MIALAACGDSQPAKIVRSPLETAIARDLTARFGTPVRTACMFLGKVPARCEATLADGTAMRIAITADGREWAWRIDGIVVDTTPIAEYVRGVLADVGAEQPIDCGRRWQIVQGGDRIACTLGRGGTAFVRVTGDGATELELALDKQSALVRSELVTPERQRELERISHGLERVEGDSDGEESVPGDGGVSSP